MQKHLKVSINGKQFLIATDENDADVYSAAQLVDSLIKNNLSKIPAGNEDKVAMLVALHLATDLAKNQRLLQSCQTRIEQLVSLCDTET